MATKQIRVLLVAAKNEVIDSRVQVTDAADLKLSALGVDSLALADAAEACQMFHPGETVALLNIGLTSASIHFVKDGISNFIRDVSWGAREMIQAIAKERRVDFDKAQQILKKALRHQSRRHRLRLQWQLPKRKTSPATLTRSERWEGHHCLTRLMMNRCQARQVLRENRISRQSSARRCREWFPKYVALLIITNISFTRTR